MPTETASVLPFPRRDTPSAQRSDREGVRLEATRRGRLVLTAAAFLLGLLVALGALLLFDAPSALAGEESPQQLTVTVEAGDTLWGYASQHAPEGVSEQQYIAEIHTLNHLPTGRVTAGEVIELPQQ